MPDSAYDFATKHGKECDDLDVWYDVVEHLEPMERKEKFVTEKDKLSAFKTFQVLFCISCTAPTHSLI